MLPSKTKLAMLNEQVIREIKTLYEQGEHFVYRSVEFSIALIPNNYHLAAGASRWGAFSPEIFITTAGDASAVREQMEEFVDRTYPTQHDLLRQYSPAYKALTE